MNRGVSHQQIFWNDESRALFLDLLGQVVSRYEIVVHSFALMPNHFHLMVETPRANLSKAMQNLLFRYSQEVNRAPGYDGTLFKGRFSSKLVLDEEHWYYLLVYLHLNPVRARMSTHPDDNAWTSHQFYLENAFAPKWLTTSAMNEFFETEAGYRAYLESVMKGGIPRPPDFDDILFDSRRSGRHMVEKQPEPKMSVDGERGP